MTEILLTLWIQMGIWQQGPAEMERARLRPWATAISELQSTDQLKVAVAYVAWKETRLAAYVLEGRCKEGPRGQRCDPGRDGEPRALGPWQLHRAACPLAWEQGPSSYRVQADCAARQIRYAMRRCSNESSGYWQGAFNGYAGRRCDDPRGAVRAREHARMYALFQSTASS